MNVRVRNLVAPLAITAGLALATVAFVPTPAEAAQATVGLGTATSYAVLAGSAVTNIGSSVINGDVGLSPGTAISGFPPGTINGTTHAADAEAVQAQTDLTAAYNDAAGRGPATAVAAELGGTTLLPACIRAQPCSSPAP